MDSKLQLFAKVLLKERYDEFLEMIQSFNIDKKTFVLQHRKMFEKGCGYYALFCHSFSQNGGYRLEW